MKREGAEPEQVEQRSEQRNAQLFVQSEVLDFNQFPYTKHTGDNIREWLLAALKKHGIALSSVSGITPDGAADGVKAVNSIPELGLKLDTCQLHGLQRSVLYAIGNAGSDKSCLNPEAAALLKKHNRFAQASNQIRAVAYGIRELQQDEGVPPSRVLSTVDTMATRWGNQYRQVMRNNMLKPVLDPVLGRWKRENSGKQDAIVDANDENACNNRIGTPVPASKLGLSTDEWDVSLEMEAFLEHPFQIKECIEHKGYMTGAQGLIALADLQKCCEDQQPLVVKQQPPTPKLIDRKRKPESRAAHLLSTEVQTGRSVLAAQLRERFFIGEVPSDVRMVQLYMSKTVPMEEWAPAHWVPLAKALYSRFLREASNLEGRPRPISTAEATSKPPIALFRSFATALTAPVDASADVIEEDAVAVEIARWKALDQVTLQPHVDDDGLLNEMALMYKLRHSFPLHYRVFKQVLPNPHPL